MMETNSSLTTKLIGSEIHGFHTMSDLDVGGMTEEAKTRWLRPNEIHAILCNHKHFTINVKPVNLPKSGRIVLFDRKMLRNFRKDGHNWKKKKDGKTVKEAHEHLKVGNEERIHVYYAHGQDNPTFVRRCYWLLDKSMEHIVLVHYRETQEVQVSPATPGISISSSGAGPSSEESDSTFDRPYYGGTAAHLERRDSMTIKNHEQRLHEINTLEWDELLGPDDSQELITQPDGNLAGFVELSQQLMNGNKTYGYRPSDKVYIESSGNGIPGQGVPSKTSNYENSNNMSYLTINQAAIINSQTMNSGSGLLGNEDSLLNLGSDVLETQDSFGRWITYATADFPGPADNRALEASIPTDHQPSTSPAMDNHQQVAAGKIFNITDVSPAWALSTEETKILVVGFCNEGQLQHSKLYLACGDSVFPVVNTQVGVFRCLISPQPPGVVNLYLTLDGHEPISQVLTFEFRAPVVPEGLNSLENKSIWEEFQLQMRLAHLLFSSKSLSIFHNKFTPSALKDAKAFAQKTSHIAGSWSHLTKMIVATKLSCPQAKDFLFELILQNRLQEWLLEQVVSGCKITERDEQGQGVIHLCAILGYTWAVYPFSCSNLSLDYRDKRGWTALHWAAYYGREKMVAVLLSAGAKPNLVTDPTPENPGGCTAADLASQNGYDGLSAYVAEKALVAQFDEMTLAGNVSGSLQTTTNDPVNVGNFNEDEIYLKDALAAYRTAADAAARIQTAFREHSLNVRTQIVESSNPEDEARNIVAAMKIQHAFRNHDTRKKIAAAARIQYRFRTWKIRKDFLNLRRQTIKLQSVFRGFQARRQYRKLCWSVGVLEKAVLRWRLKRKGFRGLQQPVVSVDDPSQDSDAEEDFFVASRKQAEERVERSVVRVQAMFRSRRAQEEYRRMKLEHGQAMLELEELAHPDTYMG